MTKLKCWKKGIGGDEWSGKNDKYSYVRVWKTGLPSKEIKRRNIKPNIFSGRIGRNGKEVIGYFNRMSQAREEAIKFMKKHDKC